MSLGQKSIILSKCADLWTIIHSLFQFSLSYLCIYSFNLTQYFQAPGIMFLVMRVVCDEYNTDPSSRNSQQDEQTHRQADQSKLSQDKCWVLWDHRRWRLSSLAWAAATGHHRWRGLNSKHHFSHFWGWKSKIRHQHSQRLVRVLSLVQRQHLLLCPHGWKGQGSSWGSLMKASDPFMKILPSGPNHLPTTLLPDAVTLGLGF